MPKQKKIKELLKEAHELSRSSVNGDAKKLTEIDACFHWIKTTIKSLRKENKRLNEDLNSHLTMLSLMNFGSILSAAEDIIDTLPVAEFKCANTNKPGKDNGNCFCVMMDHGGNIHFNIMLWAGSWITDFEVIAFTETDPAQIVNSLNKEK